jgi:hypothetical protein
MGGKAVGEHRDGARVKKMGILETIVVAGVGYAFVRVAAHAYEAAWARVA